jgi:hypothetical protein
MPVTVMPIQRSTMTNVENWHKIPDSPTPFLPVLERWIDHKHIWFHLGLQSQSSPIFLPSKHLTLLLICVVGIKIWLSKLVSYFLPVLPESLIKICQIVTKVAKKWQIKLTKDWWPKYWKRYPIWDLTMWASHGGRGVNHFNWS